MVFSHGGVRAGEPDQSRRVGLLFEALGRGFRTPPELQVIKDLRDQGDTTQARAKATELIERSCNSFFSLKYERYLKSEALYLRGRIAFKLRDMRNALDDMEKAASLGNVKAPYHAGVILTLIGAGGERLDNWRDKVHAYMLMGAELGVSDCIEWIKTFHATRRQVMQVGYWFLLAQMGQNAEGIRESERSYMHDLDDAQRTIFDQAMRTCSLSGGAVTSKIPRLPGRSTLTAAYVDLRMRSSLGRQLSVFFEEDKPENKHRLDDVFKVHRRWVRLRNPLADLWLLINQRYAAGSDAIVLEGNQLMDNLLAGDEIVVRCGRLVHHSQVWAIDQTKQEVLLEDPFYEFWQPTHNRCVTVFERQPYKYERYLVRISLLELRRVLVAVMTVRDCVHQSAP